MPADRRLTFSLTAGSLVLLAAGSAYLTILAKTDHLRVSQNRLQTVSLLLDEGSDGLPPDPSATAGGGKTRDQAADPMHETMQPLNALSMRLAPPDEIPESLIPLEKRLDQPQELLNLQPGLIPATIPGLGNGVGSGLGADIGNGLGSGLGHGRGSTWIHSAHGDEELKVAVNFLDFSDYIPPDYPKEARLGRISGDVVLRVTIDQRGTPIKWTVVQGDPLLVEATLQVFPKWHFIPPVYKGEKVDASFEIRVRFTLM